MKKDMAVVIGIGKPKRGPGAPPPFMREEKPEKPETPAMEGKEHAGMGMGMGMGKAETAQPMRAPMPEKVQAVMEQYGADPKTAKAFLRDLMDAMMGDDEEQEGDDLPPAA